MNDEMKIKLYAITLDCQNPYELAEFYAKLLKWDIVFSDDEFTCLGAPGTMQGSYPGIMFQRNPSYQVPVWPEKDSEQQQMAHLDLAVNNLEEAVEYAISCGARIADEQFSDGGKVMLDPAGHPFCLCLMKPVFDSPSFALL